MEPTVSRYTILASRAYPGEYMVIDTLGDADAVHRTAGEYAVMAAHLPRAQAEAMAARLNRLCQFAALKALVPVPAPRCPVCHTPMAPARTAECAWVCLNPGQCQRGGATLRWASEFGQCASVTPQTAEQRGQS